MLAEWEKDPQFQQYPYEKKRRLLLNYFYEEYTDEDFWKMPKERRQRIENNFLEAEGLELPKQSFFDTLTGTLDKWLGDGYEPTIRNLDTDLLAFPESEGFPEQESKELPEFDLEPKPVDEDVGFQRWADNHNLGEDRDEYREVYESGMDLIPWDDFSDEEKEFDIKRAMSGAETGTPMPREDAEDYYIDSYGLPDFPEEISTDVPTNEAAQIGGKLTRLGKKFALGVGQGIAGFLQQWESGLIGQHQRMEQIYGPAAQGRMREQQEAIEADIPKAREMIESFPEPSQEPIFDSGVGQWLEKGAMAVAPSLAAIPGGAPGIFMQLSGMEYDRYKKMGYDHDTAASAAMFSASLQTPIEFASLFANFTAMKLIGSAVGFGIGKKVAGTIAGGVSKKAANEFAKKTAKAIGAYVAASGGEGAEEYFQEHAQELADIYAEDPDAPIEEITKEAAKRFPETHERGVEAFKVGVAGGLVMGGFGGAIASPIEVARAIDKSIQENEIDAATDEFSERVAETIRKGQTTEKDLRRVIDINKEEPKPSSGLVIKGIEEGIRKAAADTGVKLEEPIEDLVTKLDTSVLIRHGLDGNVNITKEFDFAGKTRTASKNAGEQLEEMNEQADAYNRFLECLKNA